MLSRNRCSQGRLAEGRSPVCTTFGKWADTLCSICRTGLRISSAAAIASSGIRSISVACYQPQCRECMFFLVLLQAQQKSFPKPGISSKSCLKPLSTSQAQLWYNGDVDRTIYSGYSEKQEKHMPLWDSVQRSLEKASQEAARMAKTQRLRYTIDGLSRQLSTQNNNIVNKTMDLFRAGELTQSELLPL